MEGVKRGWSRLGTKEETGKEKMAGEVKRREKMREIKDRGEMCPGGTPYIRMIGMIVVFFRSCNRRFSIFQGLFKQNPLKR